MLNQRGQIHIVILVLLVIGFILYVNFSDGSLFKSLLPSSPLKSAPAPSQQPSSSLRSTPTTPATPAPTSPTAPSGVTPVLEDKTPPVRSNPSHTGDILLPGTREVVISISTDEPASCKYTTDPEKSSYSAMSWHDQTKRFHTKNITGLKDGMTYEFFVRCQDMKGNANDGDVMINFSIKP